MKVLIACEESQAVCIAFRKRGHEAYSCDLQDCSGGRPEWHIKNDFFNVIDMQQWDMIIAFPPCTHLTKAGAVYWPEKQKKGLQKNAIDFVIRIWNSNSKVAIENPVGILSTKWRPPDQIIHPYYFGDPYKKMTCLWLKNISPLIYDYRDTLFSKKTVVEPIAHWHSGSIGRKNREGVRIRPKLPPTTFADSKLRSKTFPGIAKAMAEQWG